MNQAGKCELKPKLRFPEFRDAGEWKKKTIGQISKNVIAGGTPSTLEKKYWNGNIRWMNSGELNHKRVYEVQGRITEEGLQNSSTKLIPKKCVLIGLAGQGKTRGTVAINMVELCTNQSIAAIFPNEKIFDSNFLYHNLDDRYDELRRLSAGGEGRGGLNLQIIKSLRISLPSLHEQQKIADCLSSIDDRITAETQKLDTLKAYKKGLMQQLFPAEGETLPKLRFPEFRDAGEWKEKKIGDLLVETLRPLKMQDEKEYSLVTVKRRYGGVVSRGILRGREIKVKSQFLVCENDFLISKRQIVHNACGLVPKELEDSIVSNEYSVLTQRTNCDVVFFNYFSQQPKVSESFLLSSVGIVIEKMLFKLDAWLSKKFLFPSFQKQQKIAGCLSSIDELVAAQIQKIDTLRIHKKGLMQQLFPALEEGKG